MAPRPLPRSGAWPDWLELARPFSLTASLIPVLTGGALAWADGLLTGWAFVAALVAGVLVQVGTNIINEVYDVAHGVDSLDSPNASHVVVQGRVDPATARRAAGAVFAVVALLGLVLVQLRGWPMLIIGVVAIATGYSYTAPPIHYKYRAMGVPAVFVLMGPLMVLGAYVASAGPISARAVAVGLPVGCLVASILHANDLRDLENDSRGSFRTLTFLMGRPGSARLYVGLVVGAFALLVLLVALGVVPWPALVALAAAPAAIQNARRALAGGRGELEAVTWLDIASAKVHLQFGLLLTLGIVVGGLVGRFVA